MSSIAATEVVSVYNYPPPRDMVHEFVCAVTAGHDAHLETTAGNLCLALNYEAGQMHVQLAGDLELDSTLPIKAEQGALVIGEGLGRRVVGANCVREGLDDLRIEMRASVVTVETVSRKWYTHPAGALTLELREDGWLDFARGLFAAEPPTSLRVLASDGTAQKLRQMFRRGVGDDKQLVDRRNAEDTAQQCPVKLDVVDLTYSGQGEFVVSGGEANEIAVCPVWRDAHEGLRSLAPLDPSVEVTPGPVNRNWWSVVLLAVARATGDETLTRQLRARAGV